MACFRCWIVFHFVSWLLNCCSCVTIKLGLKWKVEPAQVMLGLQATNTNLELSGLQANETKRAIGRPKEDETWDSRFEQLKQFHAHSRHFRVPYTNQRGTKRPRENAKFNTSAETDQETIKLGKWVKRQRSLYAANTLSSDRVERLHEIGFQFKPGKSSKKERTEIQLGLLDALRKRRELSNAQVADLNFLYDEWKRRAESNSSEPVNAKVAVDNKFHIKWTKNFEKLKQFKVRLALCELSICKVHFSYNYHLGYSLNMVTCASCVQIRITKNFIH